MSAVETTEILVPRKGTKTRHLHDLFLSGRAFSKRDLMDRLSMANGPVQGSIYRLRDIYGLDIRLTARGLWKCFGRTP